jgi:hypothetical protein
LKVCESLVYNVEASGACELVVEFDLLDSFLEADADYADSTVWE